MCFYVEYNVDNRKIYVKSKAKNHVKLVNTIVFDCDGVLLKTKDSYDKAIQKTVDFILSRIFNEELSGIISDGDILDVRNSGGFNNDWELTYCFILYFLYKISSFIT